MARNKRTIQKSGTSFETQVCKYLSTELGVEIERLPKNGSRDIGDVGWVTHQGARVVIECKSPGRDSPLEISSWWRETLAEISNVPNSQGGVLIINRYKKSTAQSYCVADDENWKKLNFEAVLGDKVKEFKAHPFSTWTTNLDGNTVIKAKKKGKGGFWYVMELKDCLKNFDSIDTISQISLSNIDLFLLLETGKISVEDSHGKNVAINCNIEDFDTLKEIFGF